MDGFVDAYSALDARSKILDIVSNNLANVQTAGFKRDFARTFQIEKGYDVDSHIDLSEGELVNTGGDLDAAIDGGGFFTIQTANGVRYTRAGSFLRNSQGELVMKDGAKVLASDGSPISIPEGIVSIRDGGAISVDGNEVGTLKIATFPDPAKLQKEGLYRFQWTGAPEEVQTVPEPHVKGGYLERSNVNPISEMMHLMSAYREFESAQRTVRTLVTDMNGKLIQELGKLS